ncbi:hypothetical protein [Limnoglobus roseus]|uniref:Uncharacterized protein n=1 Tax=Limnoglobus roseus TaxID=2598579 RepID=A0A5C1AR83_9BACT|nr:hypothetical protein [Limnoglobus roseus]QEL20486.1 hypothetical protein PX52LOC_07588 [Limnoglobus roseus]
MPKNKLPRLTLVDAEASQSLIGPVESLRNQILVTMGRPRDLIRIDVINLWPNTYRANVIVGPSLDRARFAHSYFVTTTDGGKVVTSTPGLNCVYS